MTYDDMDYPRSPRDSRDAPDYDPELCNDDDAGEHIDDGDYDMESRPAYDDPATPRRLPACEPIHYGRSPQFRSIRYIDRDYDADNSRSAAPSQGRASVSAPQARPAAETRPLIKADANPVLGVFGLSIRTKESDLEDEFGRYGAVEKVVIVYDQRASPMSPLIKSWHLELPQPSTITSQIRHQGPG